MANLFTLRVFARNLLRGNYRRNTFFCILFRCLAWSSNPGYTSNNPAYNLLHYGNFNWEYSFLYLTRNNLFFRFDLNKVQYALGRCVFSFVNKPLWLTLSNDCEYSGINIFFLYNAFYYISNGMNLVIIECEFLKANWCLGTKFLSSIISAIISQILIFKCSIVSGLSA